MIKDKSMLPILFKWTGILLSWFLRQRFNKLIIDKIEIKPNHSYLLMCNHFSFWDGFLARYLCHQALQSQQEVKGFRVMTLKKQMEKKRWLKYLGSFSVEPGKLSIKKSIEYAAETLNQPGNVLLFFPQGNLESSHIRHIKFMEGIAEIVPRIKGNCQLIWSSNIPEYFESMKPSVYFDLLDCGTNHDYDFEALQRKVNQHHLKAIKKNIRFTQEEI